jgi:uncharacterized membrane protein
MTQHHDARCQLCGATRHGSTFVRGESVPPQVAKHLAQHHASAWTGTGYVCRRCLDTARIDYVTERLREEKGALSSVESTVAEKAGQHLTIARNIDDEFARTATLGQRAADAVARVGGSWAFVSGFLVALAVWMGLNAFVLRAPTFDPYPFILLNLVLSCVAALQAPIIMMSQNRQAERDRVESKHDYETDLKAEIEIASLHDKVDHLLHAQWERMVELQQMQIELLTEIAAHPRR